MQWKLEVYICWWFYWCETCLSIFSPRFPIETSNDMEETTPNWSALGLRRQLVVLLTLLEKRFAKSRVARRSLEVGEIGWFSWWFNSMVILWSSNRIYITISRVIIYGMSYIYNYIRDYSYDYQWKIHIWRFPEMVNRPSHGLPF